MAKQSSPLAVYHHLFIHTLNIHSLYARVPDKDTETNAVEMNRNVLTQKGFLSQNGKRTNSQVIKKTVHTQLETVLL